MDGIRVFIMSCEFETAPHNSAGGTWKSALLTCCRVDDRSMRYVAQENIAPIDTDPSEALLRLAGKHFKRWDAEKRRFVSNIKDEYPDD